MLYNLGNGKTIDITLEQFLFMSDEEWEYIMAYGLGDYVENPFFGSVINKPSLDREEPPDATELSSEEKLSDLDLELPTE